VIPRNFATVDVIDLSAPGYKKPDVIGRTAKEISRACHDVGSSTFCNHATTPEMIGGVTPLRKTNTHALNKLSRFRHCRWWRTELPNHVAWVWEKIEKQNRVKVNKIGLALPRGLEPLFSP
jgi:hypothetical protein